MTRSWKNTAIIHLILFFSYTLSAQSQQDFNIEFVGLGAIEYPDSIPSNYHRYNDVWGWVDENGIEYGIIGAGNGTAIFSLEDPSTPELIQLVPGGLSLWRDIKSYDQYIYVVADEKSDGLLIIDMQHAPDSISWKFWKPTIAFPSGSEVLQLCHNLYIDGQYLYLAGCNRFGDRNKGIQIFDLAPNPMEPTFLSNTDPFYAHDVYADENTMYASNLGDGLFIIDVSDKSAPSTMATIETSMDFTHNAWASDDQNYVFTTDERSNAFVDAYDITDIDDIKLLDQYRPIATEGLGVIPHNVHYYNGYLVTSYYTDGLKIVDATNPSILTEVGSYDTYFERDGGFGGAWGAFPYLPSGRILVSDRESGLFVLEPNYVRPSYILGGVIDFATELPLEDVEVSITSSLPGRSLTDAEGNFQMGFADEGTVEIQFFKEGYALETSSIDLTAGDSSIIYVTMRPLARYNITGTIIDDVTGMPIPGASVIVQNDLYTEENKTAEDGTFSLTTYEGNMYVAAGKWGYIHEAEIIDLTEATDLEIRLEPGYRDDFIFDYNWEVSGTRPTSSTAWDRGEPSPSLYNGEFANPGSDIDDDLGRACYVTGLAFGLAGNLGDTSILSSPIFDGTRYSDPFLYYYLWFYDNGVNPSDDSLLVYVGNGQEEVLVEALTESRTGWRERSEIRLADFIAITESMYVKLFAADIGSVHIYEAGIDGFAISEGQTTSTRDLLTSPISVFPNPFSDYLRYDLQGEFADEYEIRDLLGRIVQRGNLSSATIETGVFGAGTYFITFLRQNQRIATRKIIKT